MKIKRLDIAGFKSFVDKTSLDFQQEVTAVVGPNGCGKSNIVDAIRWVMGEQSPKNLRGKNMEDVIFGGSESRKPLGMAEVSLVFSTEDGRVSAKYLNFSEIQVTRRLYRNGDSEYLLNKTPCRLLDIAELFMDTGAGARAYSIIEQGKIGMILHSKPEERRVIIEEAAGVVKYKARKQVALKKIDVTRQNLLRIGDIVAEIKRQLNALQRQAKKAEKFREYREELKEIDLLFAAHNYREIEKEKIRCEEELARENNDLEIAAAELEGVELELEEKKIALLEEEKRLTAGQEAIYQIKGEMQNSENRIEFQKKEMQNLDRQLARFSEESDSLRKQLLDAETELKSLEERKELFNFDMEEDERSLLAAGQELEEITIHERGLAGRMEEIRGDLLSVLSEIAQYNNQYANAAKRLESLEESVEKNAREISSLREKLADAGKKAEELGQKHHAFEERKEKLAEELNSIRNRQSQLKERFEEKSGTLLEKRDLLNKKESRLNSLQELEAQYAGYGQGVRSLLLAERFKGVFKGLLADFVEIDESYELALETVLAEKLQYVVCNGEEDAFSAVSYLKEVSGGRCSFVVQGMKQETAGQTVVGGAERLLDRVTIGDEYRTIFNPLIEDVLIATDLPKAHALNRMHPHLTFVTPQGDMVSGRGVIHGGSTEAAQQGLVHKKREIKVLASEVAGLVSEVENLDSLLNRLRQELVEADKHQTDLRHNLHQAEIDFINNVKDLQRAREECESLDERIVIRRIEDDQLMEEKGALVEEMAHSEQQRAVRNVRKAELEREAEELQEVLKVKKLEMDKAREAVTSLKVSSAALRERRESNLKAINRVEERIKELGPKIVTLDMEIKKGEADRENLLSAISLSEENLKGLLTKQVETEALFASVKQKYESDAGEVQEVEARLKELRGKVEEIRKFLADRSLKFSEHSLRLRHMEDSLFERHRMEISSILPLYSDVDRDVAEKRGRQSELQKLVDEMGEVNLMAIEEFKELEDRHNFLSSQKSDLEESLQGLQLAIQRINRTTRKRFLETFLKINEKFQEVFPLLFCGGKAELRLTNEEDLLETGIDIVIQPPGKKLQNISLLSGGEKALTAVALMFSIFMIKPTPFCLLDEVDAPLDEANIKRFSDMIRELSETSQFIIITHNKTTMSCADCLYGVTMEEPGVSKLVSVKMN